MPKLRRTLLIAGIVGGLIAASVPTAFAATGDSVTPTFTCTAGGLSVSYRASLPKHINGVWDRVISYTGTTRSDTVVYVDRDFTNTTSQSGRLRDTYTASMVLAPGEAVAGRSIEVFIHYLYDNVDSNGSQVQYTRAIRHTC
jgi:hypothetical protein